MKGYITGRAVRRQILHCVLLLLIVPELMAQSGETLIAAAGSDGSKPPATFALSMRVGSSQALATSAYSTEEITLAGSINTAQGDIGKTADIYVVVASGNSFYMRNASGGFDPWNGNPVALNPSVSATVLTESVAVDIFSGVLGLTAELDIYLAYRATNSDLLVYTELPATFTISAEPVNTTEFYAPTPVADLLSLTRPVSWAALSAGPEDLQRFSFGPASGNDVLRVSQTGNNVESTLLVEAGMAGQAEITDQKLLQAMFQFIAEEGGGYRIHSVMHSNFALDWDSATEELIMRDIRSGSRDDATAGYLVFEVSGSSQQILVAAGRKQYEASSESFTTEAGWQQRELQINGSQFLLSLSGGTAVTLYSPAIDLSIPFDFNPATTSRVSNPEVTPTVKLTNDPLASTPQQVNSAYAAQLSAPGVDSATTAAASAMLDTIESDLAAEGAQLRYPKEFYLAFRSGLLSRVLTTSDSTDGEIGQLTVPYVYFTNATDSEGVNHPFMIIASYGIPDSMALLWDVARPPGDGNGGMYEEQSVTRSYHREAYLTKIPLRDYGEVSSLTENTMVNDLASDVGVSDYDHHNYASVNATGIAVDGVVIYPTYNNTLHIAQEAAELSAQGMHAGRGLGVHYHADAHSGRGSGLHLYNARDYVGRDHPPVVSMGFDGVAGYGIYQAGDSSSEGATIALDEFGGHEHGIYGYHYHAFTRESVTEGNGGGVSYTAHILPPLGAWAGRINDIPDFWQGPAPNYVGGKSAWLGNE